MRLALRIGQAIATLLVAGAPDPAALRDPPTRRPLALAASGVVAIAAAVTR